MFFVGGNTCWLSLLTLGLSPLRFLLLLPHRTRYFIHDFTACITDIITHPSEAIHHVAAITITVGGGVVPEILAFVPGGFAPTALLATYRLIISSWLVPLHTGFLVIEASTIVYNITWFMLKTGNRNHRAYQPLLYTFAAMFFVLRCLWLPFVCYDLSFRNTEAYYKVPGIPQGIWVIVALQYYWMVLIFQKAMGGGKGKKGKKGGGDEGQSKGEGAESAAAGDKPKAEGSAASSSDGKLRQRRQEADSSVADGDK